MVFREEQGWCFSSAHWAEEVCPGKGSKDSSYCSWAKGILLSFNSSSNAWTTLAPHWYCVAYTRTSPEDSGAADTSLQSGGKWYFKQSLSKGLRNRSAHWEFPWSICILVSMEPSLCLDPHSLWTLCFLAILVYWAVPCTSGSKHLSIRWISVMGDKKYTMAKTKQQQQQRKRGSWNMYILGFSAWRSSWSVIGFGGSTLSNLHIPKSPKPRHWPVLPKVLHVSTS